MKRFILVIAIIALVVTSVFAFSANPTHPIEESDAFLSWENNTHGHLWSQGKMHGKVYYFHPYSWGDTAYVVYRVWIDWNPNREQWEEEEVVDVYAIWGYTAENGSIRYRTLTDRNLYGEPTHMKTIREGNSYESQFFNDGRTYYVRYDHDRTIQGIHLYTRTVR